MPRAHTHSARIPRTVEPESCFMGKFPPPATTWSLEPLPLQPFEAMVAEELLQWGPVRQLEIRGREMRGPVAGGHRCSKPPVEMQNQEEMIPLKLDSANFGEHMTEIVLSRRAGGGGPPTPLGGPPTPHCSQVGPEDPCFGVNFRVKMFFGALLKKRAKNSQNPAGPSRPLGKPPRGLVDPPTQRHRGSPTL